MADAGSIYYDALSGVGDDIARSMIYYHQKHQEYDKQLGVANALSRIGVDQEGRIVPIEPDAKGKVDKSIQPILDPKAVEMFSAGNRRDWARSAGALDALTRLGMQAINRASEERMQPKHPVTVGGETYDVSPGAALTYAAHKQQQEEEALAAMPREKRAEERMRFAKEKAAREARKEPRDIAASERAAAGDVRAEEAHLAKQPEMEFRNKYGIPVRDVISLQEGGYQAREGQKGEGKVLGETPPLAPGTNLTDYASKDPGFLWWNDIKSYFGAFDKGQRSYAFVPKDPNGIFRESEYKWPADAKAGRPAQTGFRANPEGEFLNVPSSINTPGGLGRSRIPMSEVQRLQNQAATVREEYFQNVKAHPERKPLYDETLQKLGYDPHDAFFTNP
jgi:hypothetical protein